MLVLGEVHTILQASSNCLSILGIPAQALLGMNLANVFSGDSVRRLLSGPGNDGKRSYVSGVRVASSEAMFDALVHKLHGLLIIEFEPAPLPSNAMADAEIWTLLTEATGALESKLSLLDLCERIVTVVRQVTGFDRVMIYRFLEDDSGIVIAENRPEELEPYLNLRYPASDIPAQARRLYLINALRLKADVHAQSAVLVPAVNPSTGKALDMTFCVLRAMSPVHVEYLRNMGVAASMSISIVKDGKLWGLIACHHREAKLVPHTQRITCELLARIFSSHIAAAEENDERERVTSLSDLTRGIEALLTKNRPASGILGEVSEMIAAAIGAHGCAFYIRGNFGSAGVAPSRPQLMDLFSWLELHQHEYVFATERLATAYPDAACFDSVASGLLSVRIATGSPDFMVWFRPPIERVVNWGGNPEKPVEETEQGRRISPRRSFESWKQVFGHSSEPWTNQCRNFALGLRPLLAEGIFLEMKEEVVRLNVELARSNVELSSFSHTASHDLQEPVRTIRAYSQLLARRAELELTPESRSLLSTIEATAVRMGEFITALLSYSQIGGQAQREMRAVNLAEVLRWVLVNLDGQIRQSDSIITHDELPVVHTDLDHMVQLLQNLIGNAIKYRQPDKPPRIHLGCHEAQKSWIVSVSDNGQGFEPSQSKLIFAAFTRLHGREVPGHGIGLATCQRIVELYRGRIWAESDGRNQGATFRFSLPGVVGNYPAKSGQ